MKPSENQLSFSIINTQMTVAAMRDSGYRSTTHALAELIDNSIEASATAIEVFGVSQRDDLTERVTLRELAVLDNGSGMDAITLRGSLRYGHGTRFDRRGIGRYGVGLPNSSMSQARRVEIWSWQTGVTNAFHTCLSIEDVMKGILEIPEPLLLAIPEVYRRSSLHGFEESGSLVVWSDLDRVEWKRASTTFRHTETLLGRIYRRFLSKPSERLHSDDQRGHEIGAQRTITCIPVECVGEASKIQRDSVIKVRPNDPLYLMSSTSCPEEFGAGPMFMELEASPFVVPVMHQGSSYDVLVRASYARPHARDSGHPDAQWPQEWVGKDAGHTPWGKHANNNMGISMIRAHREIELDASWVSGYDPTERWWTIEVDFPTELDVVFGVTNNKQGTMTFQRLARYEWQREAMPGEETVGDVRRRMEEDGDHRVYLLDLRRQIQKAITLMRSHIEQSKQSRKDRHVLDDDQKADAKATAAIKRRIVEGHKGESDRASETGSEEENFKEQVKTLVEKHHLEQDDALRRVMETLEKGNRVRWIESSQTSPAFFDVEPQPSVLQVVFNTKHPVHSYLYYLLDPDLDGISDEDVRERLSKAHAAFRILVYSWARFEEEQSSERDRRKVRDARLEWGKYAEEFFDEEDDSISPTDLV